MARAPATDRLTWCVCVCVCVCVCAQNKRVACQEVFATGKDIFTVDYDSLVIAVGQCEPP
jgi:hypothetical protein